MGSVRTISNGKRYNYGLSHLTRSHIDDASFAFSLLRCYESLNNHIWWLPVINLSICLALCGESSGDESEEFVSVKGRWFSLTLHCCLKLGDGRQLKWDNFYPFSCSRDLGLKSLANQRHISSRCKNCRTTIYARTAKCSRICINMRITVIIVYVQTVCDTMRADAAEPKIFQNVGRDHISYAPDDKWRTMKAWNTCLWIRFIECSPSEYFYWFNVDIYY